MSVIKLRYFSFLCLLLIIVLLAACGQAGGPQKIQEPMMSVTAGDQELKVIYYGDQYNETREEINHRLTLAMDGKSLEDIPYINLGDEIEVKAENFETEEFSMTDYILSETGEIRYQEKVAQTSVLPVTDGMATFPLPANPASLLSSFSGDYDPGMSIRGFVIRSEINDAPFAFAFILRTDAGINPGSIIKTEDYIID